MRKRNFSLRPLASPSPSPNYEGVALLAPELVHNHPQSKAGITSTKKLAPKHNSFLFKPETLRGFGFRFPKTPPPPRFAVFPPPPPPPPPSCFSPGAAHEVQLPDGDRPIPGGVEALKGAAELLELLRQEVLAVILGEKMRELPEPMPCDTEP